MAESGVESLPVADLHVESSSEDEDAPAMAVTEGATDDAKKKKKAAKKKAAAKKKKAAAKGVSLLFATLVWYIVQLTCAAPIAQNSTETPILLM